MAGLNTVDLLNLITAIRRDEFDTPIYRVRNGCNGQRVAVQIAVVGKEFRRGDERGHILRSGEVVVFCLRRVVHGRDGDRELLHLGSIVATVGRATIVLDLHVERRRAVGIRGRSVGQITAGIHAGCDRKEARIADVADRVGEHALTGFIGRPRVKRCPAIDRLGSSVFVDVRWAHRTKTRFVVDGVDCDRELLQLRSIVSVVGRAAVVLDLHIERGRAVGISGRGIHQVPTAIHAGSNGKQARVADVADGVAEHTLSRLVGRTGIKRRPAVDRLGSGVFIDRGRIGSREGRFVVDGIDRNGHCRDA